MPPNASMTGRQCTSTRFVPHLRRSLLFAWGYSYSLVPASRHAQNSVIGLRYPVREILACY